MSEKKINICLVDDEKNIRRLVAYDLKSAGYEVASFENGQEVIDSNTEYDAYIVDWMMPVMDGLSLVKKLREKGDSHLVIMLTAKSDEEDLIEAFEVGVDDYLSKPFSSRELLVRLKTHLSRLQSNSSQSLQLGDVAINPIKREVKIQNQLSFLTKVEFDLLWLLGKEKGNVLSRDKILNELWGFDYDGDTRIVDVHISKLRNKLAQTKVEIVSLRGVGYRCEVSE
jgi:two-component system alkaline phosphatase synthesis response regulator PhoP